jgi:LPPG:FO 2-phospho-L-lactate transferase
MITALCGGVGGAKLLNGLNLIMNNAELKAIVNVGDDFWLHNLKICPDIDSVIYKLAGVSNVTYGWGIQGDTFRTMSELEMLGGESWFKLGDLDLATHLYRSQRLIQGARLDEITKELKEKRQIKAEIYPVTNDEIATELTLKESKKTVGFQEYFVKLKHQPAVSKVIYKNTETATCLETAIKSIEKSEKIIICPSNPILSVGPIISVYPVADLLRKFKNKVIAVTPLIGGKAIKGPADHILTELRYSAGVLGVAEYYREFASTLIIDKLDADLIKDIENLGFNVKVTDTLMGNISKELKLAEFILDQD